MPEIDCRKLNCPEPVLRTKKALEKNQDGDLKVIVDNTTARENILRFARSRGYQADWVQQGYDYSIAITPATDVSVLNNETEECCACAPSLQKQIFLIGSDQLGRGSEELGGLLMRNFIYTLTKRDQLPRALIFINSGVRLCVDGSEVLEELKLLESGGVEILACGTCLNYFGLKEKLRAGSVSNMYDLADLLFAAAVVTL